MNGGWYRVHKDLEQFTVNKLISSHWCFLLYNDLMLLNVLLWNNYRQTDFIRINLRNRKMFYAMEFQQLTGKRDFFYDQYIVISNGQEEVNRHKSL